MTATRRQRRQYPSDLLPRESGRRIVVAFADRTPKKVKRGACCVPVFTYMVEGKRPADPMRKQTAVGWFVHGAATWNKLAKGWTLHIDNGSTPCALPEGFPTSMQPVVRNMKTWPRVIMTYVVTHCPCCGRKLPTKDPYAAEDERNKRDTRRKR